jgi:hypothetical protein
MHLSDADKARVLKAALVLSPEGSGEPDDRPTGTDVPLASKLGKSPTGRVAAARA